VLSFCAGSGVLARAYRGTTIAMPLSRELVFNDFRGEREVEGATSVENTKQLCHSVERSDTA